VGEECGGKGKGCVVFEKRQGKGTHWFFATIFCVFSFFIVVLSNIRVNSGELIRVIRLSTMCLLFAPFLFYTFF